MPLPRREKEYKKTIEPLTTEKTEEPPVEIVNVHHVWPEGAYKASFPNRTEGLLNLERDPESPKAHSYSNQEEG